MTITNRDYKSSLGDKESQEFQNLAEEVRDNVKNALKDSKGFISSEVEKFLEANSVNCQLKILVREDSDITKKTIKVSLENSSGNLTLTDVTVVDTEMATTMAVTDKKTPTEPTKKTMTQRPTKDDVVFEVTATIQDEVYTEDLADSTSEKFKELSKELTDFLTDFFKTKVPGFRRVEIISFRKGSVICVFKVITEESKVSRDEIKDVLTEASKNGKAGKYTFKDVNVKQQQTATATKPQENNWPAEVTNPQENKWPAWATAIIAVFGVLLLAIFIIIYVVRIM